MREIGVFICNYNKADFVVKCVEAVLKQTYNNLDIYVIDNASTDDSVMRLKNAYGDVIHLILHEENVGGSGGFGKGIRLGIEKNYKYIMLVDNDAILDSHAIEYLYRYMEKHEDVGICGAETLNMQHPDQVQDLGGRLDFVNYNWAGVIGGLKDLKGAAILETDYVASCSVLARVEAIKKFSGGWPEENFIYWDDTEWCTQCRLAGYKVIVNSHAKAYHDLMGANPQNMFFRYYANRNRYTFFTKYLPEEKLEDFYQVITRDAFTRISSALKKGMNGTAFTLQNALDDYFHGVMGKAMEGKIVDYNEPVDVLKEKILQVDSIAIYMPSHTEQDYKVLHNILKYLMDIKEDIDIYVTFEESECREEKYDLILQLCEHFTKIKENVLPRIYVDEWCNCIMDEEEYVYFSNFEAALKEFQESYRPLFEERKKVLRIDGLSLLS